MLPISRPTWNRATSSSYLNLLERRPDDTSSSHELDERNGHGPSGSASHAFAPQDSFATSLGKPLPKPLFNRIDAAALVLSAVCLGVCLAAVSPKYNLSFNLGYTRQLVVIGFLLGIMNLCLKRVILLPFLLLEMKLGPSNLQNYDAILLNSPLASKASVIWRIILVCLAILPFGLSASYKLFGGGSVTKPIPHASLTWGIMPPPGLETSGDLVMMANVTIDFLAAANNDSIVPVYDNTAKGYGLNLLLLSSNSAACLDTPRGQDIQELQNSLESNTYLDLTATVRATVTTYNNTVEDNRNNAAYWKPFFAWTELNFQNLWNGAALGFLQINSASSNDAGAWDDSWAMLGCFDSGTLSGGGTQLGNDTETSFIKSALLFNIDRRICAGNWRIRRDSIQLLRGLCEPVPLNASYQFYENTQLFLQDIYTPMLTTYLGRFCSTRSSSPWLLPTFTTAVVSMYYSRVAEQLHTRNGTIDSQYKGFFEDGWSPYGTIENVTLTKPVMQQAWTLYMVFACQPLLTLVAFCTALFFYRLPLDRGFGLVAILAGIDKNCLTILREATISGELREPVKLQATGVMNSNGNHRLERVEYNILPHENGHHLNP